MAIRLKAEIPLVSDDRSLLQNQSSLIQQNADNILLRVAQSDYNGTNLVSLINLAPDTIKIQAKNIELEGIVTVNSRFKILSDGSMEATNGSFTGNIYASTINGSTITGGTVRTSADGNRIQLVSSGLESYLNNVKRVDLLTDRIRFYGVSGGLSGNITSQDDGLYIVAPVGSLADISRIVVGNNDVTTLVRGIGSFLGRSSSVQTAVSSSSLNYSNFQNYNLVVSSSVITNDNGILLRVEGSGTIKMRFPGFTNEYVISRRSDGVLIAT